MYKNNPLHAWLTRKINLGTDRRLCPAPTDNRYDTAPCEVRKLISTWGATVNMTVLGNLYLYFVISASSYLICFYCTVNETKVKTIETDICDFLFDPNIYFTYSKYLFAKIGNLQSIKRCEKYQLSGVLKYGPEFHLKS